MSDGDLILTGKLAIGLACAVVSVVLVHRPALHALSSRDFDRLAFALLCATRVGLFLALYFVLDRPVLGDVKGSYYPQGLRALQGELVYRDFQTNYGPLFPYGIAGVLALWRSLRAIVAVAILLELVSLPLWLSVGRHLFGERTTRIAAVLYVASPVPLLNVVMNGGNQVWVSVFLALSLWLLKRQDFASGFVSGAAIVMVKLLGVLFAPVLWLFSERRGAWAAGFALFPLAVYALLFSAAGSAIFEGLRYESMRVTPGNLFFLTSLAGVDVESPAPMHVSTGVLLAGLGAVFLAGWRRGIARDQTNVVHLVVLVLLTMLLLSKKSYPTYWVMAFFSLCLTIASTSPDWRSVLLFGAFGIAATLEMSLWFRWADTRTFSLLWDPALPPGIARGRVAVLLGVDAFLLSCYVIYFRRTWRLTFQD